MLLEAGQVAGANIFCLWTIPAYALAVMGSYTTQMSSAQILCAILWISSEVADKSLILMDLAKRYKTKQMKN